jgi:hypothetical protein
LFDSSTVRQFDQFNRFDQFDQFNRFYQFNQFDRFYQFDLSGGGTMTGQFCGFPVLQFLIFRFNQFYPFDQFDSAGTKAWSRSTAQKLKNSKIRKFYSYLTEEG